jgi:gentisate 1,2-dioxygenase
MQQSKDRFHADIERLNIYALWETEERRAPSTPARSLAWQWREMLPLIDHAVEIASMENTDRRVLAFRNPANPHAPGPLSTITGALQILMPGETAPAHRHSMNALRWVMEGSGATTTVEGKRCLMERGDLILTPAWTWHEHTHEGHGRMVWFDALDVPLQRYLNTIAIEAGPPKEVLGIRGDEEYGTAGMLPATSSGATANSYSPLFRYPWSDACAAIRRMPLDRDGSRRLHYVNPLTGGAVMSLLDCFLLELAPDAETARAWTTASTICVVAEGEGVSTIGDQRIEWRCNDVFTLPSKTWHSHRARGAGAIVFQVTDANMLAKLGLLQEQR